MMGKKWGLESDCIDKEMYRVGELRDNRRSRKN